MDPDDLTVFSSLCLSHFLYIRFLGHLFYFSSLNSLIRCYLFLPCLDHFSVHFSQLCSLPLPLIYVSFFPSLTLRLSPSSSFLVLSFFFPRPSRSFILIYFLRRFLGLSLRSSACIFSALPLQHSSPPPVDLLCRRRPLLIHLGR